MNEYAFRGEELGTLYDKYVTSKLSNCIVCANNHFEHWAKAGPYEVEKCPKCDLIFLNPQLNENGLNDYYTNYIGKRRLNNSLKMEQRSEQYILDSELINRFLLKGTILDVGCSGGFFLNTIGEDYERYGTELDQDAVEYAKINFPSFGNNIKQGTLHSAEFEDEKFDLVIMRGVIEHLLEPEASIEEVSRILKPGGYYYICATPNGASFSADLYRENWTLFHPVQHLWLFSPDNFSVICKRQKLSLIWKDFPYLGTPYENVQQDILQISQYLMDKDSSVSPAFFENMMSLMFKKQ